MSSIKAFVLMKKTKVAPFKLTLAKQQYITIEENSILTVSFMKRIPLPFCIYLLPSPKGEQKRLNSKKADFTRRRRKQI